MIKFSELLEAKKPPKEKEWNLNDAKGKLFEILSGSHLHKGTSEAGSPNEFLKHYRDEEGKSPKEVHDYIKRELETRNPGMYQEINRHAAEAAQHLRDQLAAHGHTKIHETAWTSQKGDHGRFTKDTLGREIHDPNSDADLMVHTENGPVGLSFESWISKIHIFICAILQT